MPRSTRNSLVPTRHLQPCRVWSTGRRLSSKLDNMDREALLAIAADWSFWTAPPPPSVPRSVVLPAELRPDIALVVQGVRRCGKSTLLAQLIDRYELDPRHCLFVDCEDPRLANALDASTLQAMVDYLHEGGFPAPLMLAAAVAAAHRGNGPYEPSFSCGTTCWIGSRVTSIGTPDCSATARSTRVGSTRSRQPRASISSWVRRCSAGS